jgi:hypothetical protein
MVVQWYDLGSGIGVMGWIELIIKHMKLLLLIYVIAKNPSK